MREHVGLLAIQLLAFWPVWKWYGGRMAGGQDDGWGLAALATAVFFCLARRLPGRPPSHLLLLPALLTVLYAATYAHLPPLLRAAIAFTALGCTLSAIFLHRLFDPALWGLCMLSLPLLPSLQFYLGFPLRFAVGHLAAAALQLSGYAVSAQGASLSWAGGTVCIDAPCSGIGMLWAGGYLAFTLALLLRLSFARVLGMAFLSLLLLVSGNAMRAACLFCVESAGREFPAWVHDGIGTVTFLLCAVLIALAARFLERSGKCALSPSS